MASTSTSHILVNMKLDEANVHTSKSLESSIWWIRALEAWAYYQWQITTKEFEIVEIGVDEGVDLGFGIKDFLLFNMMVL